MLGTFFLFLAVAVVAGALVMRARVRRRLRGGEPIVGDPLLRRILAESDAPPGEVDDLDEPLDEDRIRDEEDRFWNEEWDDPEAWRE